MSVNGKFLAVGEGAASLESAASGMSRSGWMSALPLAIIRDRLARQRDRRRRIGWFDYSSDSWDMRTTNARAFRIFARLQGERRPLESVHDDRALPWNAYHG